MAFKSLVNVVSEQRQEINQALTLFPYFETWSPDLVAECCRVSSVVEFPPDEIILGSDTGDSHAVYFILEGVCKMIQNLFVLTKRGSRQKKALYKLYKYFPSKIMNFESKKEDYVSKLFNEYHHLKKQEISKNESYYEKAKSLNFSNNCINNKMKKTNDILPLQKEVSSYEIGIDDDAKPETNNKNQNIEIFSNRDLNGERFGKKRNSIAKSSCLLKSLSVVEPQSKKIQIVKETEAKEETAYEIDHHVTVLKECRKRRENMIRVFKNTIPSEKPKSAQCLFVEIGFLLKGACFGLEKSENENFIMAATGVKCLKIPRRFLLQHNPCNIWNRIHLFYSLRLPKEEQIFEYFRSNRKWMEKKKIQTANIISLKYFPHYTSTSEVPYSIRLSEPQ